MQKGADPQTMKRKAFIPNTFFIAKAFGCHDFLGFWHAFGSSRSLEASGLKKQVVTENKPIYNSSFFKDKPSQGLQLFDLFPSKSSLCLLLGKARSLGIRQPAWQGCPAGFAMIAPHAFSAHRAWMEQAHR